MSRSCFVAALGAFVLLAAVTASAGPPTVIFSNIASSPTSDVPGMLGVKFNPGTGTQFDRPFASPDGTRWIFGASTNQASTENEIVVTGGGLTGVGARVQMREGTPTFFDAGVNWGVLRTQMGINNAGQFAFSADTSATSTTDEVAALWNGSTYELIAREGTQAPGQAPGIGYGGTTNAVHIVESGKVRFRTGGLTGATTQYVLYENASLANGNVLAQTDIAVPGGQMFSPNQTIDLFTSDRFRSDATGAHWIYHADLNGPTTTDLVMVYDGNVVAQEGAVLPGSNFAATVAVLSGDAGSQQISPANGHYAFRGNNNDGTGATATDWVYVDGQVVAYTGMEILPGAGEYYDDALFSTTFFNNAINSNGEYVLGGVTDAADATRNGVLIFGNSAGASLLIREGDPVDLDGNGLADDNVFVSVFNNDDSFLTDDGYYYFNADLRDAVGTSLGQAYLVLQVPEPAVAALAALGVVLLRRR